MGRTSKELKAVKKAIESVEYPVENKDYYLKIVKPGTYAAPGWLTFKSTKAKFTREVLIKNITRQPSTEARLMWSRFYFMYPGPKPDPKWGPVSP